MPSLEDRLVMALDRLKANITKEQMALVFEVMHLFIEAENRGRRFPAPEPEAK